MSGNFQKKTSSYLVTAFIGVIVISFMFTGYQSFRGGPNSVASIGPYKVTIREYQNEFQRQMQSYKQMFGGRDLTSAQIQNIGLKQKVIKRLIDQKMLAYFADELGILPSEKEIKKEIKNLPYFKTNGQFDLNLYKALLSRNRLTPQVFEDSIKEGVKLQKIQGLMQNIPLSNTYLKELQAFKSKKIKAQIIQIDKNALYTHIKVSSEQIKDFIKKHHSQVLSTFNERKSTFEQKEQIKARHILIKTETGKEKESKAKALSILRKITVKNFKKMAKKYTQDPAGKKNGGDLGWFSKGRMVPEFEYAAFNARVGQIIGPIQSPFGNHIILVEGKKPFKAAPFDDYKEIIAKELIQKQDLKGIEKEANKLALKIERLLNQKKYDQIKKLQNKHHFTYLKDHNVNLLDGIQGPIKLKENKLEAIFNNPAKIHRINDPLKIVIVKAKIQKNPKVVDINKIKQNEKFQFSRRLGNELIKELEKDINIKIRQNLL